MSLRLKASPALGDGGAHTRWRRTENEVDTPDDTGCCQLHCRHHLAISDTPVSPAEAEKIKTALEAFGCTAEEMEKSESSVFAFEVDDAKCKDGEYDIKLDKDFKIIIMLRD